MAQSSSLSLIRRFPNRGVLKSSKLKVAGSNPAGVANNTGISCIFA